MVRWLIGDLPDISLCQLSIANAFLTAGLHTYDNNLFIGNYSGLENIVYCRVIDNNLHTVRLLYPLGTKNKKKLSGFNNQP